MENLYYNLAATQTTGATVCEGPCILSGVIINTAAANSVIRIFDALTAVTTGNNYMTITEPATLLKNQDFIDYKDIVLQKGLTITQTTGASNITIAYRKA